MLAQAPTYLTDNLPERDKNSDDWRKSVNRCLRTHIPEYVFDAYWQVARVLEPTEREACMASLLANVITFQPLATTQTHTGSEVRSQELACCFTLFYLGDIVVCGCDKPECQDGVKQMFDCSTQPSCGPIRCAWFDSHIQYTSDEISAGMAEHTHSYQRFQNATTENISVCSRVVTAENKPRSHLNSEFCSVRSPVLALPCDVMSQACTMSTDDQTQWASDPLNSDVVSERTWTHEAQRKYSNVESSLRTSNVANERVMLRPYEISVCAQGDAVENDGPNVIASTPGANNCKIKREHDPDSQVVLNSSVLSYTFSEDNAPTLDTSGVDQLTKINVASCPTSDSDVAPGFTDAATQVPLAFDVTVIKVEPTTPAPANAQADSARRKRALQPTHSLDPQPTQRLTKRARTTVSWAFCARE